MVITKDLSRLGRDYIQTGHYTEVYFPSKHVRYIAINDNVDTLKEDNDIAPFKNILNDMYAKDLSKNYHYTKEEAYYNIKKSGTLRFCQLACSNDSEDCRYASVDLYQKALRQALSHTETDFKRRKYIQCILDNLNNFNLYRTEHTSIFGVSLSDCFDNEELIKNMVIILFKLISMD